MSYAVYRQSLILLDVRRYVFSNLRWHTQSGYQTSVEMLRKAQQRSSDLLQKPFHVALQCKLSSMGSAAA